MYTTTHCMSFGHYSIIRILIFSLIISGYANVYHAQNFFAVVVNKAIAVAELLFMPYLIDVYSPVYL